MSNVLIDHLAKFSEADWLAAIEEILPCVHPVDQAALQIWFRFFPLDLHRYAAAAEDRDELIRGLALQGVFELKDQIDISHHFLYGHRYWPKVKHVIEKMAESEPPDALAVPKNGATKPSAKTDECNADCGLVDVIKEVGMLTAEKLKVERKLTNAIAAIGLATLNQVGLEAFKAAKGSVEEPSGLMKKSPDIIVAERAKDDSQGLFGFLKTVDKKYSIAIAASNYQGKFPVMNDQQVTHAAAQDRSQNWQAKDERCWEGPIPVECTSASCGTCWVGVVGGEEKLSEVGRRERRAMNVFGYNQPEGDKPFLRLACQTKAFGNVSMVIPPWNGVFGKKVRGNVEEVELEPNTTSAQKLREVVKSAVAGE
jgi:ferredoxin